MLLSLILKKRNILNIPNPHVRKWLLTSIFLIFRLSNVLPVNTRSLFQLSSSLSHIPRPGLKMCWFVVTRCLFTSSAMYMLPLWIGPTLIHKICSWQAKSSVEHRSHDFLSSFRPRGWDVGVTIHWRGKSTAISMKP